MKSFRLLNMKNRNKEKILGSINGNRILGSLVLVHLKKINTKGDNYKWTMTPAAVKHEFGPPAVQCKSQAPPGLLEENGLAHPIVDVKELEVLLGEL